MIAHKGHLRFVKELFPYFLIRTNVSLNYDLRILSSGHIYIIIMNLSLGLQGLYSATNCADNILGRFIMILQIKLQEYTHLQI